MNLRTYLNGRFRLWFRFCPECNSDAPALDTCSICRGYRWTDHDGPPSNALRDLWWEKFKALHRVDTVQARLQHPPRHDDP